MDEDRFPLLEHYQELWETMKKLAGGEENLKGKRVCEIGAQHGLFIAFLRDRGIDAIGVDPNGWSLERGHTIKSRFEEVDSKEHGPFDFIVSYNVLNDMGLFQGYPEFEEKYGVILPFTKDEDLKRMLSEKRKEIHKKTLELMDKGYVLHFGTRFSEIPREHLPAELVPLEEHCAEHKLVMERRSRERR